MNEKRKIIQRFFQIIFAGMLLISFHTGSAVAQIPTPTPTLITGVLTCDTVAGGVTCTDQGSYLDYGINIVVTGLTGGATASDIFIGTYRCSTNGGYMGMMSDFVHAETSGYPNNTVLSLVAIQPFDAGAVSYASFTSGAGTDVYVINQTSDWRYIGGSGGWPNTLSVKGNVDWAITGYSIVGHIYLYSNQDFAAPTPMPTATPTPSSYTLTLQPNGASGLDTFIYNTSSTTNYGTSVAMGIGENNNSTNGIMRSLIKFDLSSIPANATITSATLSLWTYSDLSSNTRNINVYRLKRPFTETQATWNIAQTGVNWQTAGASGANDRETTSIGSVQILANEPLNTQKQISLDVAKIQEFVNGTFSNNGFIVIANTELNDRFDYKSSDHATTAHRPKLVINYTVPFMTATPTVTLTLTPTNTPTLTPTPTNTPIPGWYTGNDKVGAYGVKADISAPSLPPYLEEISSSGQSNWVSIPRVSNRWMQAGWRHYWWYEYGETLPYIEWKIVNPPLGDSGYRVHEYETDLQSWGTFKTYEVTWDYGTRWCGHYANNALICDDVGISAPRPVFAHSEVHASPLNELDTIFMNVHYMDSARNWNLFDEARWVIEPPYNVDQWFLFEFRNYGP